jgi:hypothetical protein
MPQQSSEQTQQTHVITLRPALSIQTVQAGTNQSQPRHGIQLHIQLYVSTHTHPHTHQRSGEQTPGKTSIQTVQAVTNVSQPGHKTKCSSAQQHSLSRTQSTRDSRAMRHTALTRGACLSRDQFPAIADHLTHT